MGEKVIILTEKQKKTVLKPEKNIIQTALPIQSTHSKTVSIHKNKVNDKGIPIKDIFSKSS
jgi:hypothetical protein